MKAFQRIQSINPDQLPKGAMSLDYLRFLLTSMIRDFSDVRLEKAKTIDLLHGFPVSDKEVWDLGKEYDYLRFLLTITDEDYVSFFFLRSEARNCLYKLGAAPFDILPIESSDFCDINKDVISYAINFDIDDIKTEADKIGSTIKKRDYLYQVYALSSIAVQASSSYKDEIEIQLEQMIFDLDKKLREKTRSNLIIKFGRSARLSDKDKRGLLYNYWDCDFASFKERALASSSRTFEQNAILSPIINERLFVYKAAAFFMNIYEHPSVNPQLRKNQFIDELTALFGDFVNRLLENNGEDEKYVVYSAQDWASITKMRIVEGLYTIIYLQRIHKDSSEEEKRNFLISSLLARSVQDDLILHIDHIYRSTVNDMCGNPYEEVFRVIPYNIWDNEYEKIISEKLSSPFSEPGDLVLLDFDENSKIIYSFIRSYSTKILLGLAKEEDDAAIAKEYKAKLYALGTDYINRLQKKGITNPDFLSFATGEWLRITVSAMLVNALSSTYDLALTTPDLDNCSSEDLIKTHILCLSTFKMQLINQEVAQYFKRVQGEFESKITDGDRNSGAQRGSLNHANQNGQNKKPSVQNAEEIRNARNKLKALIINCKNPELLMSYFDSHLCNTSGVDAFIYVEAALLERAISRPPYKRIIAVYPEIGSEANYNRHVGKDFSPWKTPIGPIREEIQEIMSKES